MRLLAPAVAAAVFLAGCSHPSAPTSTAVPVSSARAELHSFAQASDFSGTLVASHSVTVGANASGRLSGVPVNVGDRVEAGAVLATIDAAAYSAALAQANGAHAAAVAEISGAQAALAQAKSREQLAAATAARDAALYASGDVSRQHYDETQAAWQTARDAVVQAEANVSSASGGAAQSAAAVDVAAVPLRDTVIRAPYGGIVTAKFTDAGAVVNPGSPIVSLEDDRSLEAAVPVPETLAARLLPGTRVRVDVDALHASIDGRIRAIVPSANSQLHTAEVRVAMQDRAGTLRGMFVRVRLHSQAQQHVAIPAQALATRAGQTGVFEIKDGRAAFIPVETGESSDGWIAVTGVALGTTVATYGLERLDDGTLVAAR